eukprot:gene30894-40208_t
MFETSHCCLGIQTSQLSIVLVQETYIRGLHHGVLYVLRCGLGGESNNVMMLNAKGNISTALMQLLGLAVILPASIAQLREKFCPLN